jgi:hypothetical protein
LVEQQTAMLIDHASIRAGFEIRMRDPWGPALDALYALYAVAIESAEEHYKETARQAIAEGDALWEALVRLQHEAATS